MRIEPPVFESDRYVIFKTDKGGLEMYHKVRDRLGVTYHNAVYYEEASLLIKQLLDALEKK